VSTTTTAAATATATTTAAAAVTTSTTAAAATIAASATSSSASAAAATTTFFGFIHAQRTPAHVHSIQFFNSLFAMFLALDSYKRKAALAACFAVEGIKEIRQRFPFFKHGPELYFSRFVRDIPNIQFHLINRFMLSFRS
jgi:hypothetical protein